MYYFDYTATTSPNPKVIEVYNKVAKEYWYNSSSMYSKGIESDTLFNRALDKIKRLLCVNKHNVLFTSGATEANNCAIHSIASPFIKNIKEHKMHIITTTIEHASVLNKIKELESIGFSVTYLSPKENGLISLDELKNALTKDTILVSIMWVNNIIGSMQNIKDIINIVKQNKRCKLHVDMVQGIGKISPDFSLDDVDLITFSGHKIHGLKGSGVLLYNKAITIDFLKGGHQQKSFRPGTVDVASCVAFAKALELSLQNVSNNYRDVLSKYDYLYSNLKDEDYLIINKPLLYSPYILSVTFKYIYGQTVLNALDKANIYVSTGSACNIGSHVEETLLNIYKDNNVGLAKNTIRISLDVETTYKELDYLINNIKEIGKQ